MIEAGILGEDDRVELIEGEIIQMSPIGHLHLVLVDILSNLFAFRLHGRAIIRTQGSIEIPQLSEPEPDIVVLRWRDDFYAGKHASAEDVLLIMEVADSSLRYDREVKGPLYADAGIPDYWLWDLNSRSVLVHREPDRGSYRSIATLRGDDALSPLAFPDLSITPDGTFPSPPAE